MVSFIKKNYSYLLGGLVCLCLAIGLGLLRIRYQQAQKNIQIKQTEKKNLKQKLEQTENNLEKLKSEDQYEINQKLKAEISEIEGTIKTATTTYESILDLEPRVDDTLELEEMLADSLYYISEFNYASASASLQELNGEIDQIESELAKQTTAPEIDVSNVPESSTPPSSGHSRQQVSISSGSYLVSIVSADISSTKVIVDTAAESDCSDNCPVKSLSQFVSENGAYAGVNGTYFCPASYPSCAGKTNSFDLLVMNKDKTYFNSENNVYSNNPAVIFGNGYVRFVASAREWGRDTSVNGVISNFPLLVFNGQVRFSGDGDPKKGSKGNRSFVAQKDGKVYIGVVHNVTVAESALVMKAMGMDNAMNLDNGGSTALWHGGYKVGPGRNLPNVILFK
jgi:exopolysaccharide biosynthesis protein